MKSIIILSSLIFSGVSFAGKCSTLEGAKASLLKYMQKEYSGYGIRPSSVDDLLPMDKQTQSWIGVVCFVFEDGDGECLDADVDYAMEFDSTPWSDGWIGISRQCVVDTGSIQTDI